MRKYVKSKYVTKFKPTGTYVGIKLDPKDDESEYELCAKCKSIFYMHRINNNNCPEEENDES